VTPQATQNVTVKNIMDIVKRLSVQIVVLFQFNLYNLMQPILLTYSAIKHTTAVQQMSVLNL